VQEAKRARRQTAGAAAKVTAAAGAKNGVPDLDQMRKQELLQLAVARDVSGRTQMTKQQLIKALR